MRNEGMRRDEKVQIEGDERRRGRRRRRGGGGEKERWQG